MPQTQFQRVAERDFKKIARQLATKFKWQGKEYSCTVSYSMVSEEAMALGGMMNMCYATIQVVSSLFLTDRPHNNDQVEIEGERLVVESEPLSTAGTPFLVLRCNRPGTSGLVG